MHDLISRQAAIDEISKQQTYKMFYGEDTMYFDANDIASVLASMPSAERKGKWIDITRAGGDFIWKCSECGELNLEDTYFCPNCGSRNREEEKE